MGADIDGDASSDESGTSVSLSSDVTIVAIGSHKHDSSKDSVRIYEWTGVGFKRIWYWWCCSWWRKCFSVH